jgi:hypothetical protein
MALQPSSRLGPYEVIAPQGAGGQGEVYRARDTRLEWDVAIKVLPERLSSDPSLKQRLEREAKAISKLSHHSHLRPVRHTPTVWSPDGKQILFSSNRSLIFRAYLKNADGSGSEEEIASAGDTEFRALDWSHDGKYVLLQRNDAIWYLTWPKRELQPLIETNWVVRGAQFSPDGRWVAYASNESGSMEVYGSPFPGMTSKWQASSRGGAEMAAGRKRIVLFVPGWRADGGGGDGRLQLRGRLADRSVSGPPPPAGILLRSVLVRRQRRRESVPDCDEARRSKRRTPLRFSQLDFGNGDIERVR